MARVFKVRMIFYTSCGNCVIHDDGSVDNHPHWFELAKEKWAKVYKTTGVPCSCWMCRGEEYDRKGYKQETLRIIKESEYQMFNEKEEKMLKGKTILDGL